MSKGSNVRVFGFLAWAPQSWPIEPSPNGNRQRTTVVAAPTVAAALRAFAAVGVDVSRAMFNSYGYPDMGGKAEEVAMSQPGAVFYQPNDRRNEYVLAPNMSVADD